MPEQSERDASYWVELVIVAVLVIAIVGFLNYVLYQAFVF